MFKGGDVNLCKHEHGYTSLHFAGLSGNTEVCLMLLQAGAKTGTLNTVGRTASQMAAFVGNHSCVATINNFIPKSDIDYYTLKQGVQEQPFLPAFLADPFHKFVTQINIHPIRIALNLQKYSGLADHLTELKKVLELMSDREIKRTNEIMSLKFHYLSYIVAEIIKCKDKEIKTDEKKFDFVDILARKLLKTKDGNLEVMDSFLKECIREFSHRECTIFRQMVTTLAGNDPPSALSIIHSSINGQRGFVDNVPFCHACGDEKPAKKCSKCKSVQYCDRECQRLHWFMHKKSCARLSTGETDKPEKPDVAVLNSQIQNLLVKN